MLQYELQRCRSLCSRDLPVLLASCERRGRQDTRNDIHRVWSLDEGWMSTRTSPESPWLDAIETLIKIADSSMSISGRTPYRLCNLVGPAISAIFSIPPQALSTCSHHVLSEN
jgi:hypothetical protein